MTDNSVADNTPPPAPTNLVVKGPTLTWDANADLESGLAHFIIERDGEFLARVPETDGEMIGRPVFQTLYNSDMPRQPLPEMRFTDSTANEGQQHEYRVIAVNTVGLKSTDIRVEPSWESMAANYDVPDWFIDGKFGVGCTGVFRQRPTRIDQMTVRTTGGACMARTPMKIVANRI